MRWPSERTILRWIGPAAVAALGAGALVGAVWYRYDVPVVTTQGFTSTVTQTATAPPSTLPVETRVVKETVTAPAAKPEAETRVVTVTKTADAPPPETVAVEKPGRRDRETVTETVTRGPEDAILEIGNRGGKK